MKKLSDLIFAGVFAAAGVLGLNTSVFAEGEDVTPASWIQISPAASIVTLQGGDVLSGKSSKCPTELDEGCAVEIKNIGSGTVNYKVYASPYAVSGQDYRVSFSESDATSYTQISRWISFMEEDGTYSPQVIRQIEPGETQLVYYKIEVPEDVPGGAQYAVIWAQTLPGASTSTGVQTISQAGSVVRGRSIGDTRQTAEVVKADFDRFSFGGPLHAEAKIKNTGNTDFDVNYTYTARTLFGKELYSESDAKATYPDNEYDISMTWENTPFLGLFQVEFKLSGADLDVSEKHLVLIMPVFIMILLILLLTVVIIWIIIIIRKRKERKARTLV